MRELLQTGVVRFYCMDMADIVWMSVPATAIFLMVYGRYQTKRWMNCVVGMILLCWIAVVLYATVGNRSADPVREINLIPFHSYREVWAGGNPELYRSNFMNAALFYPTGLLGASLLPKKWPGWCRGLLTVAAFAAMSAGIEYVQWRYTLGLCEIDDVIHNTAGALAGSLAAMLGPPVLSFAKEKLVQKCLQWR